MEALTISERSTLAQHEAVIERGLNTFYEVGAALVSIRDARLYRAEYTTFEAYCRERWGMRRDRAYKLISAAEVVSNVSHGIQTLPTNERQVRALAALEPEEQPIVWQQVVTSAPNGKVTAAHVEQVVEEYKAAVSPMSVHFSSETPEWYTPREIIDRVVAFFDEIDLDPCSNARGDAANVPAHEHFTKDDDGLRQKWWGRVYMNPPYGREIGPWIEKLVRHYKAGEIEAAITLIPARVDTDWFDWLWRYPICFIHGRLKFVGAQSGAPFPSVLVFLGDEIERFNAEFGDLGAVVRRMEHSDVCL